MYGSTRFSQLVNPHARTPLRQWVISFDIPVEAPGQVCILSLFQLQDDVAQIDSGSRMLTGRHATITA